MPRLALLNDGQPMVTLTGSPTFHYTTGASNPSDNGFILDSFTNPGFKFLDPSTTLGPLTLVERIGRSQQFHLYARLQHSRRHSRRRSASRLDATIGNSVKFIGSTSGTGLTGSFTLGVTLNLNDLSHPTVSASGFNITASSADDRPGVLFER